jgi:hypothetical protein
MKVTVEPDVYVQAQRLAEVTKKLIQHGHIKLARRCLQEVENIFRYGNAEIRNVISNIYVYSVSSFMELHSYRINELLPQNLQKEYYKQVNASGI